MKRPRPRPASPGQPSLFDPPDNTPPPAPDSTPAPASGRRATPADGSPQRAAELLAEIHDGRYAQLDDTDRYMMITEVTGTGAHVRYATDEDAIDNLIRSGCVEISRDRMSALHGVIRRSVAMLRLTTRGRSICTRWNALTPIGRR